MGESISLCLLLDSVKGPVEEKKLVEKGKSALFSSEHKVASTNPFKTLKFWYTGRVRFQALWNKINR